MDRLSPGKVGPVLRGAALLEESAKQEVKVKTTLQPGAVVDLRYRVDNFLGAGGMCEVYLATHLQLTKPVALKILQHKWLLDEDSAERFHREARAMAGLKHPNIVEVYGNGQVDSRPFIAFEYVEGTSLSQLLDEQPNRCLDQQAALPIFVQICDAMSHAHKAGIIHRDLKPSNIMVSSDRKIVKLVDFGIAKILPELGKDMQKLTQTDSIVGSVHYMSPEQCMTKSIDSRSDIYSMGCLMYEVMTGAPPFTASTSFATIAQHANNEPPAHEFLNNPFGQVIFKSLAKDPGKRPQSAEELRELLQYPGKVKLSVKLPKVHFAVKIGSWIIALLAIVVADLIIISHETSMPLKSAESPEVSREIFRTQLKIADNRFNDVCDLANGGDSEGLKLNEGFRLAVDGYREALGTATQLGDTPLIQLARAKLAFALTKAHNEEEAITLCRQVLDRISGTDSTSAAHLLAVEAIGDALMNERRFTEAVPFLDQYLAEASADDKGIAMVRQGEVYLQLQEWSKAKSKFQDVIKWADYTHKIFLSTRYGGRSAAALVRAKLDIAKMLITECHGQKNSQEYGQAVEILRQIKDAKGPYDDSRTNEIAVKARKLLQQLGEPS